MMGIILADCLIGFFARRQLADRIPAADHLPVSFRRRAVLMGDIGGVISGTLPHVGFSETSITSMLHGASDRRFFVSYKGQRIGTHTVLYSSEDPETRINTEIHLVVKVAFFTVFAFRHRSEEIWREGQLMSMKSETVEHGAPDIRIPAMCSWNCMAG